MPWIYDWWDDIETTELGEAAFNNNVDEIARALQNGIDWNMEGPRVLEGALYGRHCELAERLLDHGSPVGDNTYWTARRKCPNVYGKLPSNPEVQKKVDKYFAAYELNWSIVNKHYDSVKRLLAQGADVHNNILISHALTGYHPIHLAARSGDVQILEMIIEVGADPNRLTEDGKSASRIICENFLFGRKQRKVLYRLLREAGGEIIPVPGQLEGWLSQWGFPVSEIEPE